jgi:hypothetical protein
MATENPPVTAPSLADLMSAVGAAGPDTVSSLLTPLLSGLLQSTGSDDSGKDARDRQRLRRKLARARDTIRQQQTQLRRAVELLRRAARPFGACPFCWGERPDCHTCGGQGQPGYRQPDLHALVGQLAPVLRRANLTLVPLTRPTPQDVSTHWNS